MIDHIFMGGLVAGLAANTLFAFLLFLFRRTIFQWIRRQFPAIESRKPHINFQTQNVETGGVARTSVHISNAGNEPAYNVYVYMVESYPGGNFAIRALDAGGVRRPVLGIRDSIDFDGVNMVFDGCSAMVVQQLWIEFENSSGVAFRTVAEPFSVRGDVERTHPTRVVKKRLEQLVDFELEGGVEEWRKVRSGKLSMFMPDAFITRIRGQLSRRLEYGRDFEFIAEPRRGRFRRWIVRKLQPPVDDPE